MLNPATLQAGLLQLMSGGFQSAHEAANALAGVYDSYARLATANLVLPLITGAERVRMANLMAAGFVPSPSPMVAAHSIALGVTAYWTGVVFGLGLFTFFPAPLLEGQLATMVDAVSAAQAAERLARAFDTATRLAIVTFPPPVGPVPLV